MAKISPLLLSLALLAFLSACGNSNSNTTVGVGCAGQTGPFNNASFPANSQWTYQMSGITSNQAGQAVPYTEAGVFTADGNGHITSGVDDQVVAGSGGVSEVTTSGIYKITPNGTGSITLNFSGGQLNLAITMTGAGSFYLIEGDSFANASGSGFQQDTSALAATPAGNFVFRTHVTTTGSTILSGASVATVGVMSVNSSGTVTGMNEDVLLGGSNTSQRTVTAGSFVLTDGATGRGTFSYTDSIGRATAYDYYVINANTFLLLEGDGNVGLGRAEAQAAASYTNATLTAASGFVFGSHGDTSTNGAGFVNTVGQFAVDGAGNITGGSYDAEQDGAVTSAAPISAGSTYAADASGDGRYLVNLNVNGVPVQDVFYMVSPGRAFYLVNDATKVEDGTADQQSGASFSNSNLNGQFGFVMGGLDFTPEFVDRSGVLVADGNGNLTAAYVLNVTGTVTTPGCLSGSYTNNSSTNGRFQGNFGATSGVDVVFYTVNSNQAYILQVDTNTQIFGGMNAQSAVVIDPPGAF